MMGNDFQWDLMVMQLRNEYQLNNFGLHQIAQLSCGDVIESKQHTLLTNRLYVPTATERFATM
jgi:hypothetical protein